VASCFRCKKILTVPRIPSRNDACPSCGADLRCCRNCRFYDGAVYNACRETQAERVLDKERSNFCDFFRFRDAGAVFVHYSSEFVYDGTLDRPYTEDDEPAPQSVYGATKLVGERYAAAAPRHYVLRLSSLYGGHTGRTNVDYFLRQVLAGLPVTAYADRTVSPSYVPDVVEATRGLIGAGAPFGLYNCGSADWCTWADIAGRVLAACGRPDLLEAVPFANTPGRAARPQHCAMSSARLAAAAGPPRTWRAALDDYLAGRATAPLR